MFSAIAHHSTPQDQPVVMEAALLMDDPVTQLKYQSRNAPHLVQQQGQLLHR